MVFMSLVTPSVSHTELGNLFESHEQGFTNRRLASSTKDYSANKLLFVFRAMDVCKQQQKDW